MDQTLFILWALIGFAFLFYSLSHKDDWRVILIFVSVCVFFPLSLASMAVEKTTTFINSTDCIQVNTVTVTDEATAWLFFGIGIICLAVGFISIIDIQRWRKGED